LAPGTRIWSPLPPLTIPRCAGTLTYVNGGLLAAGGSDEGIKVGTAEFLALPA
jgi:hypothetical protein